MKVPVGLSTDVQQIDYIIVSTLSGFHNSNSQCGQRSGDTTFVYN